MSSPANFDVILFVQHWTQAECLLWKLQSESNQCNLPNNPGWTIHGIWPTQLHLNGPTFCNNASKLDASALDNIRNELETKWMDVHAGSSPELFWSHEWSKHGTCSLNLESTNTEKKYFQKGLDLHDKYNMKKVLSKVNIVSGRKYTVKTILDRIYSVLGVKGQIECLKNEVKIKLHYMKTSGQK